jgi:hypothetical protein
MRGSYMRTTELCGMAHDKREERDLCDVWPSPCQSRFSRQSRSPRLSQASAIAAKVFMNNAG